MRHRTSQGHDESSEEPSNTRNSRAAPETPPRDGHELGDAFDASLFRDYVSRVSSWIDVCDPQCHFGTEVPRRARKIPLLSYAIMAFASAISTSPERAISYHSRTVNMLIPILDGPIKTLDENVLAAIVLLRGAEELSDVDLGTHLFGGAQLLRATSGFAVAGGLGEAASWTILRQGIYLSLTRSQPLYMSLDCYKQSRAFYNLDGASLANQATFLCAQVLIYAFGMGEGVPERNSNEWEMLNEHANEWYRSRPRELCAYWVEDTGSRSAFPSVWMTRPVHVIAYQLYYMARLLLSLFNPHLTEPSIEIIIRRRQAEEQILTNLRMVIGLSISHKSNFSASFHARHVLEACGHYLKGPSEQREALEFLRSLQLRGDPRAESIAERLKMTWTRLSLEPVESFVAPIVL
ncbi:hypothetical protein O1611_g185 [Lasiodiplodia mahajangana]|uniref:Uncharacterized protein n=1 Tax=Lasiodiplodia mahajangana TaxID=1108764 RepID=A0ACC2K1S8_9PEZI|nr:hypothetical protein O1611_g185 [Lasiodiplodia mahajangana]